MDDFKIDFSVFGNQDIPQETVEAEHQRTVQTFRTYDTQKKMRLMSEASLEQALDWHLEEGTAYHVISYGDVDSLTYLKHIVKQQKIKYVLITTWCMATADAQEIKEWVSRGDLGRADFYVGEIFKSGYRGCLDVLEEICRMTGGRVARVRNHSKIMAFYGERFSGVIESSANVDTNPRIEQTCITINKELADFYKKFFDGMKDYDKRFTDWTPWEG